MMTKTLTLLLMLTGIVACTKDERDIPLKKDYVINDFSHPFIISYQLQRKGTNLLFETDGLVRGKVIIHLLESYDGSMDFNSFLDCKESLVNQGVSDSVRHSINHELANSKNACYALMIIPTMPTKGELNVTITEYGRVWF